MNILKKILNYILIFCAFLTIPMIMAFLKVGGGFSIAEIISLPFLIILLALGFLLMFSFIGALALFVYIFFSQLITKSDDYFKLYDKLENSKQTTLGILLRPIKIILFVLWGKLKKLPILTNILSTTITMFIFLYLLWCWGLIKFNT